MLIVGLQAGVARTSNEVDGTILGYCVNLRYKTRCKQFFRFHLWLGESSLWLLSAFCPKILGGNRELQMLFCHSMIAG